MSALTRVLVPSLHFYRRRQTYSCTSAPMRFLESLLERTKKRNNSIDYFVAPEFRVCLSRFSFPCEFLRVQSDVSPSASTTELKAANKTRNCRFQHSKVWKLITSPVWKSKNSQAWTSKTLRVWKLGDLRRVEGGKIWEFKGSKFWKVESSKVRGLLNLRFETPDFSRIFFFSPES